MLHYPLLHLLLPLPVAKGDDEQWQHKHSPCHAPAAVWGVPQSFLPTLLHSAAVRSHIGHQGSGLTLWIASSTNNKLFFPVLSEDNIQQKLSDSLLCHGKRLEGPNWGATTFAKQQVLQVIPWGSSSSTGRAGTGQKEINHSGTQTHLPMKHHQVRVFWATLGQTPPTAWLRTQQSEMSLSKKLLK